MSNKAAAGKIHAVEGGAGINLHVREWGKPDGIPILFIHGWSQNHLSWIKQCQSELQDEFRLVSFDLRGHGMSDAPLQAEQYTDGDTWADDVMAIMDRLALERPILVGWSYGGLVISDYLRRHGSGAIAGINFVGAVVAIGPRAFGSLIGPGFLEHAPDACADDLPTNIAAVRRLLRACFAKPISQDDFETALAFTMAVHPTVRGFLLQREVDFTSVLRGTRIDVLVTQGRRDTLVLPAMADHIASHCKSAQLSYYEGVGHAPFLEEPARFNRELASFAKRVSSKTSLQAAVSGSQIA